MQAKTKFSIIGKSSEWAYVEKPLSSGVIKVTPQDFVVEEELGFALSGEGEHVWLYVEKTQQNTLDVHSAIARKLNIPPKDIAYSGLKDKQAVTKQWFSVFTKKQVDYQTLGLENARVIRSVRHRSKLKRGSHQANYFEIIVRQISDQAGVEQSVEHVRELGVPNYFGMQRFGRSGNNIDKAQAMFSGELTANRHQRSLYLSAARAFLFNQVLSERVRRGDWNKAIVGDVMMLAGTNSYFKPQIIDEEIANRLIDFDIHPSAPLWGKGNLPSSDEVLSFEGEILKEYPEFTQGLERFGLRQQRRATRLLAQDLAHEWLSRDTLKLNFRLLKGTFATTVLRELLTIDA